MTDTLVSHGGLALSGLRRLHFIGIGGAGMSGIALVLHARGFKVTGSDLKSSRYTGLLEEAGIPVVLGHAAANLDDPDVVVISSAIPAGNRELVEAGRRGVPVVKRAEALAWLMEGRRGIAVCGTHGKTTTTSMISRALVDAGRDPSFLVVSSTTWAPTHTTAWESCSSARRTSPMAPCSSFGPRWPSSPISSWTITATTSTSTTSLGSLRSSSRPFPATGSW